MKYCLSYSGGLDSTVTLYKYRQQIHLAVSFNYGSKHNIKEIFFAKKNCYELGIKHITIDLKEVGKHLKSSLINGDIPLIDYDEKSMRQTVVPFRNGIMLSILAGIADSNSIEAILIANHFGDHSIYPDCTKKFIKSINEAIKHGTHFNVSVFAPFVNIDKTEIVKIGVKHNIDFSKTWSCYLGKNIHCGVCGTCRERKKSFISAKIQDPTEYEQ